jgi:hypothetical protein
MGKAAGVWFRRAGCRPRATPTKGYPDQGLPRPRATRSPQPHAGEPGRRWGPRDHCPHGRTCCNGSITIWNGDRLGTFSQDGKSPSDALQEHPHDEARDRFQQSGANSDPFDARVCWPISSAPITRTSRPAAELGGGPGAHTLTEDYQRRSSRTGWTVARTPRLG